MKNNDTELKCTWTNGLIWAAITAVAALGIRYALWYFIMWQGDTNIFFDAFATLSCWLTMVTAIFPVIYYLLSYRGYMRLAAHNPANLHGVAEGKYGRPWVLHLILLLVTDAAWTLASLVTVSLALGMDLSMVNDATAVMTLAALCGIGLALDVILFGLGNKLFKPDLVQNNS